MVVPFDEERPSGDSNVLRSHPPTATSGSPQIREPTSKRLVAMPPAVYNTAIILTGNESGSCAGPPLSEAHRPDAWNTKEHHKASQTDRDRPRGCRGRIGGPYRLHSQTSWQRDIRSGARTRGAATLLKKHVQIRDDEITLRFPGKGGKSR